MKFYLTTPIYYVNAKPHIGHAYTTLASDIVSRYLFLRGDEPYFLTGTDEHGAKVEKVAKDAGKDPKEFCDEISSEFKTAWKNLGIEYSDFIRTTDSRHESGVAKFLCILKDSGALYEAEYKGLYCTGCENFITEKDLVDGKCPHHNKEPEVVLEKNWFFRLSDYKAKIKELIEKGDIEIYPEFAKAETLGLLGQDVPDFSVSRENVSWGIPLPWDNSQTTYVWVDALLNYLTASLWNSEKAPWPPSVQFVGKDILKFHAVFWPAMLLAAGLELPKKIVVHGYFTIDGQKMSKTLGNVIDPNDLVEKYGKDGARYLIISQFPFGQDGDVKAELFDEQYNANLANGIGNLVSRVASVFEKNNIKLVKSDDPFDISKAWEIVCLSYENFAFEDVLKTIFTLVQACDRIVEEEKIWELAKTESEKCSKVFYSLFECLRHISLMAMPIIPNAGALILESLGERDKFSCDFASAKLWGGLGESAKIKKPENLFPRK